MRGSFLYPPPLVGGGAMPSPCFISKASAYQVPTSMANYYECITLAHVHKIIACEHKPEIVCSFFG